MLEALHNAGWRNYSLFLRQDGLLVGYVESANFAKALDAMKAFDVNTRWQNEMREFFVDPQHREADRQIDRLEQVFYLP